MEVYNRTIQENSSEAICLAYSGQPNKFYPRRSQPRCNRVQISTNLVSYSHDESEISETLRLNFPLQTSPIQNLFQILLCASPPVITCLMYMALSDSLATLKLILTLIGVKAVDLYQRTLFWTWTDGNCWMAMT